MAKQPENLIYGIRAVIETIRSGKDLEKIFVQNKFKGELLPELNQLIKDRDIPVSRVPNEKLNRLTRKNYQGVVAYVSPVKYFPLDQVVTQVFEEGKQPLFILLDGVTDIRNFGSIARTAECMGVNGIIIPAKGSAQINADAVKTSAGALNFIPVCRELNLVHALTYLKESGIQIIGCTEKGKDDFGKIDLTGPTCIIMGSEDVGISQETLKTCDEIGKIHLSGSIESLNVGAACAMVLYEVSRQRGL
ncbi:MAG: 23S rRNA (guanosine(2251)-2'-O)-methyltransferase RlmB [Cytophagales bacterium]|nr:23S rRNA (guanosine(2251)-2'-O)-methyltransferase RlmB [Cytophagales bacterium]